MLEAYAPVLVLLVIVAAFAVVGLGASEMFGAGRRAIGKDSAYECGLTPRGDARVRLSIHFYLVAVLFILFDVESIFLILWATTARGFAAQGVGGLVFLEIFLFVGLLAAALAYVWRKGGLQWDR